MNISQSGYKVLNNEVVKVGSISYNLSMVCTLNESTPYCQKTMSSIDEILLLVLLFMVNNLHSYIGEATFFLHRPVCLF